MPRFTKIIMSEESDEVNFLHADKHESVLQIDLCLTMIFDEDGQTSSKYPK